MNLFEAADRVAAAVAGRADEIDALRRLPDGIADALSRSTLLRMLTPAAYGGHELPVAEFFAVIERLARADPSVAWCTFIAGNAALIAAHLPEAAARPVFEREELRIAGVYAPRGTAVRDGEGWRVNGRWAWGSGAHQAHVVVAGCLLKEGDAPPKVLSVLLDREQVQVLDNWDSLGLRGSGSGEFEVRDAWVPMDRSAAMLETPRLERPLYRFPMFGLLAVSVAAVASGIAAQAIDDFVALANEKVPQGSRRTLAERGPVQEALARHEAAWRGARALLLDVVARAWRDAEAGTPASIESKRDLRLAAAHLAQTAAALVDRLHSLAGGSAVFSASPLARALRDVHVAAQHMMVGEPVFELAGRTRLGLPVDPMLL